jgi:hypothetical protein
MTAHKMAAAAQKQASESVKMESALKIIYCACLADPWVQVARKLKEEHGYEPVYWNGFRQGDAKTIRHAFPGVIFQSDFDACKGIFPKEIAERFSAAGISIDFLKEYSSYELQAIKMMDRMDPDRYSFNFMERQRHFRNLVKYWTACIDYLQPDLVVCDIVPHIVFDYVLYLLCKFRRIKYVTFLATPFTGRVVPLTEIDSIGSVFDEEYDRILKSGSDIEALKRSLPEEILEQYDKMKLDYTLAEPDYMRDHKLEHAQSSGLPALAKKFILDLRRYKDNYFGHDGFLTKGIPTFFKQRRKSIENSGSPVLTYAILKLKANAYKKKLKKYYDSLVTAPDFGVPYVVFPLHFQPELTSSPSGDIFVDQGLCIEVLAKNVPPNCLIYVKEHPTQFYAHTVGQAGRIPEFYQDILANPRVRLMPLHVDPFELFAHATAVATVTGTSGWEAMVKGKPVISFGLTWYEKYAGVLKIVDEKSASQITPFIQNFKFDERNLLAYLNALGKKSVRAYAHYGMKEKMNQDEGECVSNLADTVFRMAQK